MSGNRGFEGIFPAQATEKTIAMEQTLAFDEVSRFFESGFLELYAI